MKYSLTILLTVFLFCSCHEQKQVCKPEKKQRVLKFKGFVKTIKAKVDFIHYENDSTTVFLKSRKGYNQPGYNFYSCVFKNPIPDTLKIGKTLTLYPKINPDSCQNIFRLVAKK